LRIDFATSIPRLLDHVAINKCAYVDLQLLLIILCDLKRVRFIGNHGSKTAKIKILQPVTVYIDSVSAWTAMPRDRRITKAFATMNCAREAKVQFEQSE
jgi:hypothetical protein